MGSKSKGFTNISIFFPEIMVADHDISDHDLRNEIKMIAKLWSLFRAIVSDIKLVAKLQVTASKALIKNSYNER